jgi:hypothetical protein
MNAENRLKVTLFVNDVSLTQTATSPPEVTYAQHTADNAIQSAAYQVLYPQTHFY